MARQTLNTIKNWFKTGLKPSQQQFWDTWDSFFHKDDIIPSANIENLDNRFNQKADTAAFNSHLTDSNAHKALLDTKADKTHNHTINEVTGLEDTLAGKQAKLNPGHGITITADNEISAVSSGSIPFGSFIIFKAPGNLSDELEAYDWVRGFISEGVMITAAYNSGPEDEITSYDVLEQIEFNRKLIV